MGDGRLWMHPKDNTTLPMHVRGISWFGLETQDMVMNGLWSHPMTFYMDLMAREGFNVIRVPFSAEWAVNRFDQYPYSGLLAGDPIRQHRQAVEILDDLFDMAHERDILILLDLHRLNWNYISELWYSPENNLYPAESFFTAWFAVLDRYHNHPALWGVDLLNEPHGRATWGTDDPSTDWRLFVETALPRFEERYPTAHWVYLVEGIGWGKSLADAVASPVRVPPTVTTRLAYSAHNYGRSVVPSIDVQNLGALHWDWDTNFGAVRKQNQAVVIGEYGGQTYLDSAWMDHFVDYCVENGITDTFFWSLGPNSGDVAGYLLDDWTTVDEFKRGIVQRMCPEPLPMAREVLSS